MPSRKLAAATPRRVGSSNGSDLAQSPNQLTIEQLAQESGMSVRNIRSHQARGLLAPPQVRLRVGYYGAEQVAQLELIRDLQDEGFNLRGIKRLMDATHGTADRLLRFSQTLGTPDDREHAETITLAELGRRFRVSARDAPKVLAKAHQLGVLVPIGENRFEVPSPSLLAAAKEVAGRGISLERALEILEEIEKHFRQRLRTEIEGAFGEITRRLGEGRS